MYFLEKANQDSNIENKTKNDKTWLSKVVSKILRVYHFYTNSDFIPWVIAILVEKYERLRISKYLKVLVAISKTPTLSPFS